MPLNHLKVITVTVNPTPPKPAGSKLLNSICFYLNNMYTHTLCVQLQHQHFNGWWSVQYIFFHQNNVTSITNSLIQNPKMYEAVHHISTSHCVLWTDSSVNIFITQKVFILNINQYQEFHFEYQSVSRKTQ
jgi:hypothetical protein